VRSRILPFGEAAVLVQLEAEGTLAGARRAHVLADAVRMLRRDVGDVIGAPVPGASSVLVPFDPLAADVASVASLLEPLLAAEGAASGALPTHEGARLHELQVRYGGEDGPDLPQVGAETGLGERGVVELHASVSYEVLFLGFAPGFAYLGELPPVLVLPRLPTPRVRVPPGSVAIAGPMTAVYPGASAGGWRLLGRTDAALFNPTAEPPARLRPGDRVRFVPA
jgi:5-oxoprolinase (ATP-hydrolysing) subunit B